MRPSKIEDASYLGSNRHEWKLRVGQIQYFQFQEGDPPPWYDPSAEKLDRPYNPMEENELRKRHADNPKLLEKKLQEGVIGYIGKLKGLMQILWERGMYQPGMQCHCSDTTNMKKRIKGKQELPEHLDMKRMVSKLPDFIEEKCAIQHIIEDRGHIFVKSPVCHCELAGYGIEYCWGYGATIFRKINDCTAKKLETNVRTSLSSEHLTMERVWKFSRRTRDYMRMYDQLAQDIAANPQLKSDINHNFYEKAREKVKKETRSLRCPDANTELAKSFLRHAAQVYKSHRSVAEIDNRFINNA